MNRELLQNKVNFIRNTVCRLCLLAHENLVSVFDDSDEEEKIDIPKYIFQFFAVEITKNDPYSTYVCKSCWDVITAICKYRLEFRKNDAVLRSSREHNKTHKVHTRQDNHIDYGSHHPSVSKILTQHQHVNLQPNYFNSNFDAKVDLSSSCVSHSGELVPTVTTNTHCTGTANLVNELEKSKNKVVPNAAANECSLKRNCHSSSLENKSEEPNKRMKRTCKKTEMFGNPLCLDDENSNDNDILNQILQIYSSELDSSRNILNNDIFLRKFKLVQTRTVQTQTGDQPEIIHYILDDLVSNSLTQGPKDLPTERRISKRISSRKFRSKSACLSCSEVKQLQPTDDCGFQEETPKTAEPMPEPVRVRAVRCSEDTWNRFSTLHYEQLDKMNDQSTQSPRATARQLSASKDRSLIACPLCNNIFGRNVFDEHFKRHYNNPLTNLNLREYKINNVLSTYI